MLSTLRLTAYGVKNLSALPGIACKKLQNHLSWSSFPESCAPQDIPSVRRQNIYKCNALAFSELKYGPASASLYRKIVDARRRIGREEYLGCHLQL